MSAVIEPHSLTYITTYTFFFTLIRLYDYIKTDTETLNKKLFILNHMNKTNIHKQKQ